MGLISKSVSILTSLLNSKHGSLTRHLIVETSNSACPKPNLFIFPLNLFLLLSSLFLSISSLFALTSLVHVIFDSSLITKQSGNILSVYHVPDSVHWRYRDKEQSLPSRSLHSVWENTMSTRYIQDIYTQSRWKMVVGQRVLDVQETVNVWLQLRKKTRARCRDLRIICIKVIIENC